MRTSTSSSHVRYASGSLATAAFSSAETRRSRKELEVGEVAAEAARGRRMRKARRYAREALTTPALLSQRERREKDRNTFFFVFSCSPLSLRERGVRGVRASEGRPPIPSQTLWR